MQLYLADANVGGHSQAHEGLMRLYLADTSTSMDVALAEKGMPMKTYLADTSGGLNQSAPHSG